MMINFANSYPSVNFVNLNLQDEVKNLKNIKEINSPSDKTQAVDKILGYGVDKEGFFTSDFNEAAKIPKDYKINANFIKALNKTLTTAELTTEALYDYINWAKEFGNFYKENLQALDKFGENFDREQIENKFNVSLKDNFTKSDVLLDLFININTIKFKEGKSTLFGKTYGFDSHISEKEMNEFYAFMQKNQIKDPNKIEKSSFKNILSDEWMGVDRERSKLQTYVSYAINFHLDHSIVNKAKDFKDEFDKLLRENLNLEEFKTQYLDFKKRHDEFVKDFEMAMDNHLLIKPIEKNNFTSIQSESQNKETYKDDNAKNELLKKILENKFGKSEELELLFGIKFSDDKASELSKMLSKNTKKSVDIKA
ncbi:hypothetical protein K7R89_000386 [Campylobacter upsaliensis]|nr:hypothetical protein [Campylobacter upsaliensis]EAL8124182.1 hypothetical protein [Campylobacter upsaliensis]EFS9252841.1 hypothetical protein [Campylobacter upsaliensis]EIA7157687.1 hypothetical protein [Campylobacter upsaliensis]